MPCPNNVKWEVLLRYGRPAATWVETGTYMGETTAVLAGSARHVYSIEPSPELAAQARNRFAAAQNVTILEGTSETEMTPLLESLSGDVSFWLDGHYSAGVTFRGPSDTPIVAELSAIGEHLSHLDAVTVLVDDVRCFDPRLPEFSEYPPRSWLVDWATDRQMTWTIEHDIFAAWN